MADLLANGIDVYPQKEFDEDSEDRLVNEKFRVSAWGWMVLVRVLVMSWVGSLAKCIYFLFQRRFVRTRDPARAQSKDKKRVRKAPGEGVLSHPHHCTFT